MPVSLSHRSRTWSVFKTLNKYNYSVHNNLRLFFSFFFFLVNSTFETDLSLYIWLQFIKFTYSMLSHSISSTLYFSCVNRHWDCFYFFHFYQQGYTPRSWPYFFAIHLWVVWGRCLGADCWSYKGMSIFSWLNVSKLFPRMVSFSNNLI